MASVKIYRIWHSSSEGFKKTYSGSFRAYVSVNTDKYLINYMPIDWPGIRTMRGIPIGLSHKIDEFDESYYYKEKTARNKFINWGEDGWIYHGIYFSTPGFRSCLNSFIEFHNGNIEEAYDTDEPNSYFDSRGGAFHPLEVRWVLLYPGDH